MFKPCRNVERVENGMREASTSSTLLYGYRQNDGGVDGGVKCYGMVSKEFFSFVAIIIFTFGALTTCATPKTVISAEEENESVLAECPVIEPAQENMACSHLQKRGSDREKFGASGYVGVLIGAILTLLLQIVATWLASNFRRSESLTSVYREQILKVIVPIGSNLYSMLACCDIYLKHCAAHSEKLPDSDKNKKAIDQALMDRKSRIENHRSVLKKQIEESRYLIWDEEQVIERSLRLLVKFAYWISNYRYRAEEGLRRVEIADALRVEIDKAFIEMLNKGKPPAKATCSKIHMALEEMDDRNEGKLIQDDSIVAGVDFVVPAEIVTRYVEKFSNSANDDKVAEKCKVFAAMINALNAGISDERSKHG